MYATNRNYSTKILLSMILRKGDSCIIASHLVDMKGTLHLAQSEVRCIVKNIRGAEVYRCAEKDIVKGSDNCVASVIQGSATKEWQSGTYFVTFEIWEDGVKVHANEVEQIEII